MIESFADIFFQRRRVDTHTHTDTSQAHTHTRRCCSALFLYYIRQEDGTRDLAHCVKYTFNRYLQFSNRGMTLSSVILRQPFKLTCDSSLQFWARAMTPASVTRHDCKPTHEGVPCVHQRRRLLNSAERRSPERIDDTLPCE
jgi:hypothetical protein